MTAGRSVKPPSIIDKAISLVKGFDPKKQTGDSYADEATQTEGSQADKVFLKQVQQQQHLTRGVQRIRAFIHNYDNM